MMAWGSRAHNRGKAATLSDIMSEQLASVADEEMNGWTRSGTEETDEVDPELALALKLSLAQAEQENSAGAADEDQAKSGAPVKEDDDFAYALQLQEEENAALQAFQEKERGRMNGKVRLTTHFDSQVLERQKLYQASERRLYTEDDADEVHEQLSSVTEALLAELNAEKEPRRAPWPTRNKNLKGQGGDEEIITKHDPEVSGLKNWSRLVDKGAMNVNSAQSRQHKLSNRVFNSLNQNLKKQGSVKGLSATVERETIQTHSKGLDQKTRLILHRFINAGLLEMIHGVIRTGKEAVVYHALGSFDSQQVEGWDLEQREALRAIQQQQEVEEDEEHENDQGVSEMGNIAVQPPSLEALNVLPQGESVKFNDFAVKVFKTTLTEFKNRLDYVRGDHRFRSVQHLSRQNPRKIVQAWAEKEYRNLIRAFKAQIPCPYPVRLSKNVLLMEFIGKDGWPAPRLKDVDGLSSKRWEKCYLEVLFIMHSLIVRCNLVHADLSEYNLLYQKGREKLEDRSGGNVVVIDMGQSVLADHPNAAEFLEMDCKNVTLFFKNRGVQDLIDPSSLALLLMRENQTQKLHKRDSDVENIEQSPLALEVSVAQTVGACPRFAVLVSKHRSEQKGFGEL